MRERDSSETELRSCRHLARRARAARRPRLDRAVRAAAARAGDSSGRPSAASRRGTAGDGDVAGAHAPISSRAVPRSRRSAQPGFRALSAARRHGQRQDRGLPALDRGRARGEPSDAAAGARDRPDAAARRASCSARFGGELALLHSALTERERFDAWRTAIAARRGSSSARARRCSRRCRRPGLVIVDEEHDASLQAADAASATRRAISPSCARASSACRSCSRPRRRRSRASTTRSKAAIASSRCRGGSARAGVPRCRIVDLKQHASRQALSTPLVAAIGEHLAAGNQVLLFLNRRGFAPALFCPELQGRGAVRALRRAAHRARARGRAALPPLRRASASSNGCARTCGSERIAVGAGTQRVDDELAALFPGARIARLDRDVTSRKGALAAVLDDVASGNTEILIGTQMLDEGPRLPARDARRRAECGSRTVRHRPAQPRAARADDPAGRGPRGPRRSAGRGRDPDALSRASAARAACSHSDYAAFATLALAERARGRLAAVLAPRRVARGSDASASPRLRSRTACAASRATREPTARSRSSGPRRSRWSARTGAIARSCCFAARSARRCTSSSARTLLELRSAAESAPSALEPRHRSARALNARGAAIRVEFHACRWRAAIATPDETIPHRAGCGCCSGSRSASSSRPACTCACRRRRADARRRRAGAGCAPRRLARARARAARAERAAPQSAPKPERAIAFRFLRHPAAVRGRRARGRDSRRPRPRARAPVEEPGQLRAASRLVQRARRMRIGSRRSLALLGIESHVQRVTIDDDVFHRVRIGPIDDLDAAQPHPPSAARRGHRHDADEGAALTAAAETAI